jgi:DNA-binding response OmpR family regulator
LTLANKAEDSDWAKSVGADAFVSKPFDPIELLATLKALKA